MGDGRLTRQQLWDYNTSRQLIETKYPWFLETFDGYKYPVQRADAIRYFILYTYGGVYLDLDTGCARKMDPLLEYPAFVAAAPALGLTNSIMGSSPGHPFFLRLIDSLQAYDIDWVLPYLTIMNSAGPHFISEEWYDYIHATKEPVAESDRVRLLMVAERQDNDWSIFWSVSGRSWHNWDNTIFVFVHNHVVLVAITIGTTLVASACFLWFIVYKLSVRAFSMVKSLIRASREKHGKYDFERIPQWNEPDAEKGSRLD